MPPGRASFCHAREVASAHIAAWERGRATHHYLLGGADATFLEVVQLIGKLLGHSQLQTTQRYAHLSTERLQEAADSAAVIINRAVLVWSSI